MSRRPWVQATSLVVVAVTDDLAAASLRLAGGAVLLHHAATEAVDVLVGLNQLHKVVVTSAGAALSGLDVYFGYVRMEGEV